LHGELAEQRKALRKAQREGELPAVAATAEQLGGRVAEARALLAEQREPATPVPGRARSGSGVPGQPGAPPSARHPFLRHWCARTVR